MIEPNFVVDFTSYEDLQKVNYKVLVDSIAKSFTVAMGNLEQMKALNQLGRELKFYSDMEIQRLQIESDKTSLINQRETVLK